MSPYAVILTLFPLVSSTLSCGYASCGQTEANVCAKKLTADGFMITSQGCTTGMECSAHDVMSWWELGLSGDTLLCMGTAQLMNSTGNSTTCLARQTSKSFKSGAALVFCTTDSDCLLEDLQYNANSCQCALRADGRGVCQPDPSSNLFWEYWSDCGSSNTISDEKEVAYWMYYMQVWWLTQSNNTCVNNLKEMKMLTSLYQGYVSGAQWALSIIGLTALWS